MSPVRRCLYEELGIPRTADDSEIRRAYRAAALVNHPDKNRGVGELEASERFKAVQHAYEVLSDQHERAWYDSHRDVILRGRDPSDSNDPSTSDVTDLDLFSFFTSTAYSGFDGAPNSFFAVYDEVFSTLASEEREVGASHPSPAFGGPDMAWDDVRKFYQVWEGFSSRKSFGVADKWNLSEGPNRDYRRAMERENKRERAKAKKEYNLLVRDLAAFVKKRDPRVKAQRDAELKQKAELQQAAEARLKLASVEKQAKAAHARAQRDELLDEDGDALDEILAQLAVDEELDAGKSGRGGRGRRRIVDEIESLEVTDEMGNGPNTGSQNNARSSGDIVGDSDDRSDSRAGSVKPDGDEFSGVEALAGEYDSDDDDLFCAACNKSFRSQAQKINHESSKKHVAAAKSLRARLDSEDRRFDDDFDDVTVEQSPVPHERADVIVRNSVKEAIPTSNLSTSAYEAADMKSSKRKKMKKRRATVGLLANSEDQELEDDGEVSPGSVETSPGDVTFLESNGIHVPASENTDMQLESENAKKAEKRLKRREKRKEKANGSSSLTCTVPDSDLRCKVCKAFFPSRNKLMTHISAKGHATV
jgi:DnaJ homolog subfamily A member 5